MKHTLKERICIYTHLSEEKHLRFFTEQEEQKRNVSEALQRAGPMFYKLPRKEVKRKKMEWAEANLLSNTV